ncbi:Alkanal monooxygenase alpha chain [Thalassovita gelatinovora]|uniref:Alkanal monooxygenase alpha chain n=1 Tax=Thalassovita gelatinovora TaxID=53501 RepID=A0A0P1FHH1_THAGE|nr:LLM class oxidoreductase [Thalassovita gelatinovora]QIZ81990.1 LLM class oxidoreductase [Thalassovita gelatinovora]CUH67436.1 Alkanal monooxygenase alpha chain [Thalassovita gelatinovora]SEP74092.1 luciferase-type oxidoreductase, BA3436 family [Thalassovita gelatinovora]
MRDIADTAFASLNRGYNATFRPNRLSLGLVVPIAQYPNGPVPDMAGHLERAQLAERLGFAAVWLRDVPFNVPSFGDAGQLFDPFTYLGFLAGQTSHIALGVASIVLPLRHPAHVAKAAASADVLSAGRLILGVASGDRPEEYPAMNLTSEDRGVRFRESFDYIRAMSQDWPSLTNGAGQLAGDMDMLPKPLSGRLPMLITGSSRQDSDWIARNGDGWMTYPRPVDAQASVIAQWQARALAESGAPKPVLQPLYIDLSEDPDEAPRPIHLGFRSGVRPLATYLRQIEKIGVNHVALNLRFNQAGIEATLEKLAADLLPHFTE